MGRVSLFIKAGTLNTDIFITYIFKFPNIIPNELYNVI